MVLSLPRAARAAGYILLAAAGPAAQAHFRPGLEVPLGADLGLRLRGAVGLPDGSLLAFDDGPPCRICTGPGAPAECRHERRARLLHLDRIAAADGRETWRARSICSLPPTVAGILGFRAGAVHFNDRIAGVIRLDLVRKGDGWWAGKAQAVLGIGHLLELGIPFGCSPNLALSPDGGLVLAFDDGVALLPAGTDGVPGGALRWLLGRAPTASLAALRRPSLVPSVAADGTLYVVDLAKGAVFRFAADTRRLTVLAKADAWPGKGFTPVLLAAHRDSLLVSGLDPQAERTVLVALAPDPTTGAWQARPVDLALDPQEAIRFTPAGDLLVLDHRQGNLRLVRARVPGTAGAGAAVPAGARTETKAGPPPAPRSGPDPGLPGAARALDGADREAPAGDPALRPVDKGERRAIAAATAAFAASLDFDQAFAQLVRPLGGAGADPEAAGLSPALNPFSLGHGGLKQVVRWMLRNADEANHPADMADWLKAGKPDQPEFSFGLYRHARHAGVVLAIHDLQREYAARIDREEETAGTRVADQLEPAGGTTGFRLDRAGVPRYYQGLTLTLGPDHRSLLALHPGGAPGLAPPAPAGSEQPAGETPQGPTEALERK